MDEDDKLPRFSYDLIDFLDETVARPKFPDTANRFHALDEAEIRRAAFTAGARSVIDGLIAWRDELEEVHEEITTGGLPDETGPVFPKLFDTDGEVREIASSVHVARESSGPVLDD